MFFFKRKKNEDVKQDVKTAEIKSESKSSEIKPEQKAQETKPITKSSEVKNAPKKEAVKTEDVKTKEKKPAVKAEAAKTEAKKADDKSDVAKKAPAKTTASKEAPAKTESEDKTEVNNSFAGKFEIKKSKDDRYVFNLYAANSVIVATSQVYSSSTSAMNGIKSVIENANKAPVEDQSLKNYETLPYPKWEIYQDKGGQYRFRLSASNGSCICHSQGYTSKASCKNGIESIKRTAQNAKIDKSYLKKD